MKFSCKKVHYILRNSFFFWQNLKLIFKNFLKCYIKPHYMAEEIWFEFLSLEWKKMFTEYLILMILPKRKNFLLQIQN